MLNPTPLGLLSDDQLLPYYRHLLQTSASLLGKSAPEVFHALQNRGTFFDSYFMWPGVPTRAEVFKIIHSDRIGQISELAAKDNGFAQAAWRVMESVLLPRTIITVIPARPKAGETFIIAVELVDGPADEDLTVSFEKHRIYIDTNGQRELCPIQPDYFAEGGEPAGFDIPSGKSVGTTPVQILSYPKNPPCPYQEEATSAFVELPDRVIFTAFIRRKANPRDIEIVAREHVGVTIDPPAPGSQAPLAPAMRQP